MKEKGKCGEIVFYISIFVTLICILLFSGFPHTSILCFFVSFYQVFYLLFHKFKHKGWLFVRKVILLFAISCIIWVFRETIFNYKNSLICSIIVSNGLINDVFKSFLLTVLGVSVYFPYTIAFILYPILYLFYKYSDNYEVGEGIMNTGIANIIMFIICLVIIFIVFNSFDYYFISDDGCEYRYGDIEDKPILYLYSENDIEVNIKMEHPELLLTTYPKYKDGWLVNVCKDGSIYDKDNKYYYALYWDEKNNNKVDFSEGFYVTKDNAIEFLEEKLSYIGLNDRERNEFIMYWLPKLEDNGKSLVYFELTKERENNNKLIINPKPDSLLRINMHIKKVNNKVYIKEQELESFDRVGFVAVEWGGTIHK